MLDTLSDTKYKDSMLTTLDNPFNPFVDFDAWNQYDTSRGYNTTAYLARITKSSDDLSDEDESLAISHAIAEILEFNVTNNYIAVTEENWKDRSNDTN